MCEVLVYPVAGSDMTTESYVQDANAKPLNKAMMAWFTDKYFRTPADGKDPRIDLVDANLAGLPPTTIINASIDPLRSEGELLATRMRAANVKVNQETYSGVTHEFFGMGVRAGDLGRPHLMQPGPLHIQRGQPTSDPLQSSSHRLRTRSLRARTSPGRARDPSGPAPDPPQRARRASGPQRDSSGPARDPSRPSHCTNGRARATSGPRRDPSRRAHV